MGNVPSQSIPSHYSAGSAPRSGDEDGTENSKSRRTTSEVAQLASSSRQLNADFARRQLGWAARQSAAAVDYACIIFYCDLLSVASLISLFRLSNVSSGFQTSVKASSH
ncbi:unnamed protein product [Phytophthora lilii]|uniref:Unnamed protein product n=1 Tax=Phytophthora lilii TaxID=2077276 RepID=A0A9W6THK5_9STRA|nr:unnamed protein product [Phytophthora lilii]